MIEIGIGDVPFRVAVCFDTDPDSDTDPDFKRKDVIPMVCATVKEGLECFFMSKGGCQFNGGHCHTIVEQCEGCQRVQEFPTGKYCISFPDPSVKWRSGICNMATHVKSTTGAQQNGKINPLKASKRKGH